MDDRMPADASANEAFDPNKDYEEIVYSDAWKTQRPAAYSEYREMWDRVPRTKQELDFPIHVDIETSTYCNLACPMCSRTIMVDNGELEPNLVMTRKEYASIIDQAAAMGSKSIKLGYNNEPLTHKDIVWQVEYAKQKGIIDVLINTNATVMTKAKSEALLKAGIDGMFVSFDAASPDLFAKQRVGASIGRVTDNLYEFVKLRNELRPGCQIRLSMVMYDDPVWQGEFASLQTMWKRLVDAVGYTNFLEFKTDEKKQYAEVPGWWCSQPFQRIVLKLSGKASLCCPDVRDELAVGDWRTTSLADLWRGERAREIRRMHADGKYHSLDACARCDFPHLEKKCK